MSSLPLQRDELLRAPAKWERRERMELPADLAAKYRNAPARVAARPCDERHRVPGCESEAYVWVERLAGGTLKHHFVVENPQGVSAKAAAVILDRSLSGLKPEQVLQIPPEVIQDIFGRELSSGRNLGLTDMLVLRQAMARQESGANAAVCAGTETGPMDGNEGVTRSGAWEAARAGGPHRMHPSRRT